jgi:hypothetical protein
MGRERVSLSYQRLERAFLTAARAYRAGNAALPMNSAAEEQ